MSDNEFKKICDIISELDSPKEVETLLNALLTKSEIEDVIQRIKILKMLNDKDSQRNISKKLSVSLCKITRGAKIFKDEKSSIRKILFDESWRKQA